MRCLECQHPMVTAGLLVAMEQREHFALKRNAEVCTPCALKLIRVLEKSVQQNKHWHQCVDCAFCGSKLPIARLRFQIKDHAHQHIALCENCYQSIREHLVGFPNFVGFIEKEWQAKAGAGAKRAPWPTGAAVKVVAHGNRFEGQLGLIEGFRGLVQPWYGYDVKLRNGIHHFFHERDLHLLNEEHSTGTPPPHE
jgi:hypothetical protein